MMLSGEFNDWVTGEFHANLERIINKKQHRRRPYFILVHMTSGYTGPLAMGNDNHLIATDKQLQEVEGSRIATTDVDLSKKTVVHVKMICLETMPPLKMIGTSLWRVDNVLGDVRCMYILPADKPIIEGPEMEAESKLIFESAKGMPLAWNQN